MKLDELEKMAKETAAFGVHPSGEYIYSFYTEQLQAFAKLVAEHERNECAKLADISVDFWVTGGFPECAEVREAMHIGEAIRARKQA
jgi:hypothetical protein